MFKFNKEKLEGTASKLAQKSGKVLETGKLKLNISSLEKEIGTLKTELGDKLYQAYKSGSNAEAELTELCNKIDGLYQQIEEINQQIASLQE